jgi:Tat protein secretion system quality control protein TatD with DNase activity
VPSIVKYNEQFQSLVNEVPIESLFCETDSPFLHPDKEKDNEPVNVIESYKKIQAKRKMNEHRLR